MPSVPQPVTCLFQQYSQYSLAVRGSDRDGGADGMSAECECVIKILDVNDNIPYLEQSSVSICSWELDLMTLHSLHSNSYRRPFSFQVCSLHLLSTAPVQTHAFLKLFLQQEKRVWTMKCALISEVAAYDQITSCGQPGKGSLPCFWYFDISDICLLFQYDIKIEENALHSQLAQIRVIDLDEEFSDNWKAVIFFISGNEGNWFEIEMNERTNVGILKVVKVWHNYPK